MNEDDKYLFDLTGYLVLKDVLTAEEVAALNAGIDRNRDLMSEIDRPLSGDSKTMQGTSRRKDLGG
ncbi:MAG: phytanoyl-CoA dioxygenase family protein, partial [Gemmatimonadetes bacterium]|nr:phytanoyl-CoA dioxygenase family protein [Gemmatimonadota bacterium]